ncbi:MAG: InlB B-repeat-containing protein [Eubacteriales bacterium]|nr:InlB B-repeat-containing protein [Eubacteriales bacterium]
MKSGGAGIGGGSVDGDSTGIKLGDFGSNGCARNITISGGIVNVNGCDGAAGIGAALNGIAENITISGGSVRAVGGYNGAGIGGGSSARKVNGSYTVQETCKNIRIMGGVVNAKAGKTKQLSAAPDDIGVGAYGGTSNVPKDNCGSIIIDGGSVVAGSFSSAPVNSAGYNVYDIALDNPKDEVVYFDNAKYDYANHKPAADSADDSTVLHAYRPYNEPMNIATMSNPTVVSYGAEIKGRYYYLPAESRWVASARYTVNHYWQNISDITKYDLNKSEILYGEVGTPTQAAATPAKDIPAYYEARSFQQAAVAEDGSTVINIYYDLKKYSVRFDTNGYGQVPAIQSVVYGQKAADPGSPKTDAVPYEFGGWYTTSACTTQYDFNTPVTGDITVYAQWASETCTIKFVSHTAVTPRTRTIYLISSGLRQLEDLYSGEIPTRSGYTFSGFYTEEDGAGICFYDANGKGQNVHLQTGGIITVYAYWKANTYTIKFNNDTGDHTAVPETSTANAVFDRLMPQVVAPTRPGYIFGGYFTHENGQGRQYYAASSVAIRNMDVTALDTDKIQDYGLYAYWILKPKNKLTFDNDGGTGSGSLVLEFSDNEEINNRVNPTPTKSGCEFMGYYSGRMGTGTQYYDKYGAVVEAAKPFKISKDTTLYAYWQSRSVTITFDQDGGKDGTEEITAYIGEVLPDITAPTRTGYTFTGYYTGITATGTQYYNADCGGSTVLKHGADTGELTLHANWAENIVTVNFYGNGGTGGPNPASWIIKGSEGADKQVLPDISDPLKYSIPRRHNYKFLGYFDTPYESGGTMYYTDTLYVAVGRTLPKKTTTLNLYARWEPMTESVELYPNGGEYSDGSSVKNVIGTVNVVMPTLETDQIPVRKGYNFAGFNTKEDGSGTLFYNADGLGTFGFDGVTKAFYAQWTPKTKYTVSFDDRGGSGGEAPVTLYEGIIVGAEKPSVKVPDRPGYTFGGYNTAADGSGKLYYDETGSATAAAKAAAAAISSDLTLYASWTANSYKLTLDPNNGNAGRATMVDVTYGEQVPDLTTIGSDWAPTREGYTFAGFYENPDGTGTRYYTADGTGTQVYDLDNNGVAYARWIQIPAVNVMFNDMGGTGGPGNVSATKGSFPKNPIFPLPEKLGYSFTGYYTDTAATAANQYYREDGYQASGAAEVNSDITLYAGWKADTYKLTLNANGGTDGNVTEVNATYGSALKNLTTAGDLPIKPGYIFIGYYTSGKLFEGTQYYDSTGAGIGISEFTADTELFAQWIENDVQISFDNNGGTGGPSIPVIGLAGTDLPAVVDSTDAPINAPSMTGYRFTGYYDTATTTTYYVAENADGTGAIKAVSGVKVPEVDTLMLYAGWEANTYTLTFDANSGTLPEGVTKVDATYGQPLGNLTKAQLPTRTGYTFGGYYSGIDSSGNPTGTQYYSADGKSTYVTAFTENSTAIAYWVPIPTVTMSFDNQGGSGGPAAVQLEKDSVPKADLGSIPQRANYTFLGYYDGTDTSKAKKYYGADGKVTTAAAATAISSDITLYAAWKGITVTLTLDDNGGTGGDRTVNVVYGEPLPKVTVPTNGNKAFIGYFDSPNLFEGTQYFGSEGEGWGYSEFTEDKTLYAQWADVDMLIFFDNLGGEGGLSVELGTPGLPAPVATDVSGNPIKAPTLTGYTFNGYYDIEFDDNFEWTYVYYYTADPSDPTAAPVPNTAFKLPSGYDTLTLYADWAVITHKLKLEMEGGTTTADTVTSRNAYYGEYLEDIDEAALPTKAGYTFGGYYSEKNGQGIQYYGPDGVNDVIYELETDSTAYAFWYENGSAFITLDRQGGLGGDAYTLVTQDTRPAAAIDPPTMTGYNFLGYYAEAYGEGVQFYDASGAVADSAPVVTDDMTLYAYWQPKSTTISFDLQGGVGAVGSETTEAYYGLNAPDVPVPTKQGYVFMGYYTGPDGTGVQYYEVDGVSYVDWDIPDATITLYALWYEIPDISEIMFVFNDAGGAMSGTAEPVIIQVVDGVSELLPDLTADKLPVRDGYTFGGYYTAENGGGAQYYAADGTANKTVSFTAGGSVITLYAYWIAVPAPTPPTPPAPVPSSGGGSSGESSTIGNAERIIGPMGDTSISGVNGEWKFIPGLMIGNGLRVIDGTAYLPMGSAASPLAGTTGYRPDGSTVDGAWQYLVGGEPYNKGWLKVYNPYAHAELGQHTSGWFYFGEDTLMKTGWFTNAYGNTFYLNRSSDGTLGEMATGWREIDGAMYFFEDGTGSTDLNLLGVLYKNMTTPDGHRVDADGKRIDI